MRAWLKTTLMISCISVLLGPSLVESQITPLAPSEPQSKLSSELLSAIGISQPKQTPLALDTEVNTLPVKVLYEGTRIKGEFNLDLTLFKTGDRTTGFKPQTVSKTTLLLNEIEEETTIILNLPEDINSLQLEATVRDTNQNLVLSSSHPLPVLSNDTQLIQLTAPMLLKPNPNEIPEFTGMERISGVVTLPRRSKIPNGSTLHVQLLENALAGGLSMELVAQKSLPILGYDEGLSFELERGLWNRPTEPDMTLKAWITDLAGRKIYVMSMPAGYNGPDIDYDIKLVALKQGRDTKRGLTLSAELMAQTLVQGEASFDPINGIPGDARLSIKLKQDRGDYNRNPVLAEQTLLLRNMETQIPFTLSTDSTHFDPYAPAPFLSISLTDKYDRIYYESGDIRAREDNNFIRLYPR